MGRKRREERENHDRWLVSYADFITLLFAFFVVMFATSQSDKAKAQQFADAIKAALDGKPLPTVTSVLGGAVGIKEQGNAQMHGPGGQKNLVRETAPKGQVVELLPSQQVLTKELEQEIKRGKLQISMGPRGLTISFQQAALFASGDDVIVSDAYPTVRKIAAAMNRIPNPARLEGHTDSIPIHNSRFRSNWELSAARSIALLELLSSQFDVGRDRLSIAGYADTAPVGENNTEEGRARNRRVDIVILNQTGLQGEPARMGNANGAPSAQPSPDGKPSPAANAGASSR